MPSSMFRNVIVLILFLIQVSDGARVKKKVNRNHTKDGGASNGSTANKLSESTQHHENEATLRDIEDMRSIGQEIAAPSKTDKGQGFSVLQDKTAVFSQDTLRKVLFDLSNSEEQAANGGNQMSLTLKQCKFQEAQGSDEVKSCGEKEKCAYEGEDCAKSKEALVCVFRCIHPIASKFGCTPEDVTNKCKESVKALSAFGFSCMDPEVCPLSSAIGAKSWGVVHVIIFATFLIVSGRSNGPYEDPL